MAMDHVIRGIDDKDRLLRFFAAKRHVNLVLRIVDVLEMRYPEQDYLIDLAEQTLAKGSSWRSVLFGPAWRKRILLKWFHTGWFVLPIAAALEQMDLVGVVKLQEIIYSYQECRRKKGEPHLVEPCPQCGGKTVAGLSPCKHCGGDGQIITFIEMSAEESRLAEGRANG